MITKLVVSFVSFAVLVLMTACDQATSPIVRIMVDQEGAGPETTGIAKIEAELPLSQLATNRVLEIGRAEAVRVLAERLSVPYTANMKVLFEEMTLVQLLSDTQKGWAVTACAGNGLSNIRPLADGPMILIPNAGDLSIEGSNVSIKLSPDSEISFIPRVQGERIRLPQALGDKAAGEEVLSLTFEEGMQLMAAGKLTWTVKDQGPYGTGHGLPGHIAMCDPLYAGRVASAPELVLVTVDTSLLPKIEVPEAIPQTGDMKTLFEEMTLVQLLSDTYKGWAVTACAGSGLKNIKPLPDEVMILIPNAGDLSVEGSNVAIKLSPRGEIIFIPRVPGERIMMPMDLGAKKAGQEVDSLTLEEGMRLMAAEKLVWTARDQGPYGDGHGLPGHIAICDPFIAGQIAKAPELTFVKVDPARVPELDIPEAMLETPDMKVLLEEMTLVQLLSDTYKGWAVTACAGNGLKNIKPLPDEVMILIPNAGDLSVEGSNVAIQLTPDGKITFIPRVLGERIRMPMDLGAKKAGEEVYSLTFAEGMRLMAAENLVWTAKGYGPYGTGHGLQGHITICDPLYAGPLSPTF